MPATCLRIAVILGVSVGAGGIRGWIGQMPWIPDVETIVQKEDRHEQLRATVGVDLQRFLEMIELGALVIDARPTEAFAEGHLESGFYPPVLNVPPDEIYEHADRLTHPDVHGLPVVLYCTSETCDYAEELYDTLESLGFMEIWIYFPGWEGIVEAGLPTAAGPDDWTGFDDQTEADSPHEIEP